MYSESSRRRGSRPTSSLERLCPSLFPALHEHARTNGHVRDANSCEGGGRAPHAGLRVDFTQDQSNCLRSSNARGIGLPAAYMQATIRIGCLCRGEMP